MATSASYYLNAPSLGSATAVFSNESLTTLAADGFYSNGVIVREQVSGVLLPQQNCPTCATPCGETINASGGQGIYLLDLDTGSTGGDVGAVIVRFDPFGVPDGIRATLGANVYNKLTSPVDGLHQSSTSGNFTYVGQTSGDCGISGTTYPALTEFSYNGTAFVATGDTQSITVNAGDVSLGASAPGSTMMVIPKLTASPSIINFEVVGPCSGTAWQMSVDCPVLLTGFSSSVMAATSVAVCELTETVTYYNASLANTPGTVGLYDFVYADAYGSTPLTAGYYLAAGSITGSNDWFQVNSSGVVIALGVCAAPPEVSYNCVEGICTDPGDGTGTYSTLEACESACSTPVAYTIDNSATGTALEACGGSTTTTTVYALPGYTTPIVTMIFYDSSALTTPFIGSAGWRKLSIGGTNYAAQVDVNGELTDYITCPAPPEVSYNCVSGTCIDPGDGSGFFNSLEQCQENCAAPTISLGSAQCRENNCNDNAACTVIYGVNTSNVPAGSYITVLTGTPSSSATVTISDSDPDNGKITYYEPSGSATPVYFTLQLRNSGGTIIATSDTSLTHQSFWSMLPLCTPILVTYNCVSGTCIDPGDGTGTYSTLEACEEGCIPITYNCVSGTCIDPGDGTGTYSTLEDCESECVPITYNCVSGNCVDPGDGTGTYSTLEACEEICGVPASASLAWSFTETNFAAGNMDLYVNGSIVESRSTSSSGTYTVYEGDTINVEVTCYQCTVGVNTAANAYCIGIIADADCAIDGVANIFTAVYTVTSGDLGTTLTLNTFAACDSGCV